jgi:hypothetical protein
MEFKQTKNQAEYKPVIIIKQFPSPATGTVSLRIKIEEKIKPVIKHPQINQEGYM